MSLFCFFFLVEFIIVNSIEFNSLIDCTTNLNGNIWDFSDDGTQGGITSDNDRCPNGNNNDCCVIYPSMNMTLLPTDTSQSIFLNLVLDFNAGIYLYRINIFSIY